MRKLTTILSSVVIVLLAVTGCKKDTSAPVITLTGSSSMSVTLGTGSWSEPGYTATDDEDGDVTSQVTISGTPNYSIKGNYTVTYTAKDKAGNEGTATRTVIVANSADFLE